MKTRKARMALYDGTVIEVTDVADEEWTEWLRLNERWHSGRTGGIDFHHRHPTVPSPLKFEYEDIMRIDLWPGSEEPR